MKENINSIAKVMSEKYSSDISCYDDSFLEKTIGTRMTESNCQTVHVYIEFLVENSAESVSLLNSLRNSYSEFFRNPLTFLMLEQYVIPNVFKGKKNSDKDEVRIWSAGCAAGQEAYSLAILAEDYINKGSDKPALRIFATDKCENELQMARKGIYHTKSIQNARLEHINKYFSNSGEYYSINDRIKKSVSFSVFDLLDDITNSPPESVYGDFDIVMCCNLLFYYSKEIQQKILARLYNALIEGGFLITGEAEVEIIKSFMGFRQYAAPVAIFIKT